MAQTKKPRKPSKPDQARGRETANGCESRSLREHFVGEIEIVSSKTNSPKPHASDWHPLGPLAAVAVESSEIRDRDLSGLVVLGNPQTNQPDRKCQVCHTVTSRKQGGTQRRPQTNAGFIIQALLKRMDPARPLEKSLNTGWRKYPDPSPLQHSQGCFPAAAATLATSDTRRNASHTRASMAFPA